MDGHTNETPASYASSACAMHEFQEDFQLIPEPPGAVTYNCECIERWENEGGMTQRVGV